MLQRKHRYDDCEYDESSCVQYVVSIRPIHKKNQDMEEGVLIRFSSHKFKFIDISGDEEILNYSDWEIKYLDSKYIS